MSKQSQNNFLISPVGFQDILVLVALHSLVAVQLIGFADDPGTGWHLSTGNWILSHHSIPKFDPFLFADVSRPWVAVQWLSDVLLWLIYSAASWPLLYAVLTIVFAFAYFGILYRGVTRITGQHLLSTLALIVAFKTGQVHFILRPVIFSLLLFILVYVSAASFYRFFSEKTETALSLRRMFYTLPILFMLWANLHPAFPAGLLLLALLPLGIFLDRLTGLRSSTDSSDASTLRALVILLLCCTLATFLNPNGYGVYADIWAQMGDFATRHFMEWSALSFHTIEGRLFEVSFCAVVLGLFCQPALRLRIGWFGLLSVLIFAHLSLNFVRFVPYYGIVVMVPLVYALQSLGESDFLLRFPRVGWYREKLAMLESRERSSMHGYAVLSALLVLLLIDCTANHKLLLYEGSFGPGADRYPYAALDVVKETSITEGPIVVAAPIAWGGFITLHGEGEIRAIIDDRTTLLGSQFYEEYFQSLKPGSDWMGYLLKRGANRLLLPRQDALAVAIKQSGDAPTLFEDEVSILFELPSVR